jgi:O-antigen/teichoic acid export membrane protein
MLRPLIDRFRTILGRHQTVRAHFWQSLANYVQQGGSVLLGVVLARLLMPADFGAVAYAAALIGLICMPLEWSAAQVLVSDRGKTPELFSEVMSVGILVMAAKLLVSAGVVVWQFAIGERFQAILIALASVGLVAGTASTIYRAAAEGMGHFKANFHVQMISMALAAIVGIGGALAGWGPLALAIMSLVTSIPPFLIFPRYVPHRFHWRLNRAVIKSRGAEGFWIWLIGICSNGLTRADRLFLGRAVGEAELGNYTRAYNYANLSSWALNSFMTSPAVVSLASAPDAAGRRRILRTNAAILSLGALGSFSLFGILADPLVPLMFGEQWREAIPAFQAFSPINFCAAFLYLPVTLLLARKRFRAVAIARAIGLALLVGLACVFGSDLDPKRMAAIFQAALVLPGIICWWMALPELHD